MICEIDHELVVRPELNESILELTRNSLLTTAST
jgi:hypothetical protein